jgi:methylmalonyl-CoA/ethylmalonyl-CoA epimerase
MKIEKIDHISFAVRDLEETKRVYREDFGLIPTYQYIAESEKIKVARYVIGEVAVEFMESTAPDGEVAKFIDNRGEGAFLISY